MTDQTIQFEGGDVLANLEERTLTGLLIPYNEEGRTNVGRFQVEAGAVALPTDPDIVGLNVDHERHSPVGRAVRVWEDPARGVMATFKVARTPEGDEALANPGRRKLSGEFGPAVIKGGKLVAGHAKLWGAALVTAGAFPSAQVLAADTPEELEAPATLDEPVETSETTVDDYTDESGKTHKRKITRTTRTEPDGAGGTKTTITEKTVLEEPEPTPAPTEPTPAPTESTPEQETEMPLPNTLPDTQVQARQAAPSAHQVYAAIANLRANPQDHEARQVLAALTDIKLTGSGSLPSSGVLRENWVGNVNQGMEYEREYITLGRLGTDITAAGKKGFKVQRGTSGAPIDSGADLGNWAGNKAAIGSYAGHTTTLASTLYNFALGNDIDRRFYDLPGGAEAVEAFLKDLVEDHRVWSDEIALDAWVTAAGAPVPPGTYPTEYSDALGMLIQGILAVKAKKADKRRDKPSFAIVNDAAFEQLMYTPHEQIPEFIKFSFNTDRTGLADTDVVVVSGDIGIEDTPAVLVGAQYAIEFDELAGGPLWVDALNIANGGIDKAVHGYLQVFPVRTEAVVLVGTADV